MRNPSLFRATRIVFAVLALCVTVAAIALSTIGLSDHVETADAVVVPGNTVNPDGSPSNRLKSRLDTALAVFRAGHCKVIFVSGATGAEGVDESEVMKAYLVKQGVPLDRIIQDKQGFNTAATARNAAIALHQRGYSTVLAVSQFFHVPRLRRLLAAQGLVVVGSEHARYFELRDVYSLLREVAAMSLLLVENAV
jgi:vancomycin permeability regulator SanA